MEIQQIIGFIAVAQSMSFSKAAERTHRTQPAVSLQIRALEEEFNSKLFDRLGPQKVTLTEEGRLLYEIVEPILGGIREIDERFNEARNKLDHFNVIVASHNSAILNLFPPVVKTFTKQFPKAKLTVLNRQRENLFSMVKNDEAHVGITTITKPPVWANYEMLVRSRRVLICRKDHPICKLKRITLKTISKFPLIVPPIGHDTRQAIDDAFAKGDLSYELAVEVMGDEAVKRHVEMGIGVSISNESNLPIENRGNLIVKDVSEYFGTIESGLLTRKGRYLNRGVKYLMELVRKEIKTPTGSVKC
jgi:DNA-binding transcriptional LysR family regulator